MIHRKQLITKADKVYSPPRAHWRSARAQEKHSTLATSLSQKLAGHLGLMTKRFCLNILEHSIVIQAVHSIHVSLQLSHRACYLLPNAWSARTTPVWPWLTPNSTGVNNLQGTSGEEDGVFVGTQRGGKSRGQNWVSRAWMLGMLMDMMQRWNVNIMRVQKTKCDGNEARSLAAWLKLFCCGINGNFSSLVEVIFGNVEDGKIRNDDIKGTANVSWFGKSQRGWIRISGTIQRKDTKYIGRRMLKMELT